jgi:hypothetical protein
MCSSQKGHTFLQQSGFQLRFTPSGLFVFRLQVLWMRLVDRLADSKLSGLSPFDRISDVTKSKGA